MPKIMQRLENKNIYGAHGVSYNYHNAQTRSSADAERSQDAPQILHLKRLGILQSLCICRASCLNLL